MVTLDSLDLQKTTPQDLGELLMEAKKAYYTGSRPIMDDHTYDTLEDILRKKLPYHRVFTKVGHPNFDTGFDKKSHTMFMGSQNKVTSLKDLIHYFELKKFPLSSKGVPEGQGIFVVEPKCDGISLEIEYKNGHLVDAVTRGDGLVGDIVTQNVVQMKNFVAHPDKFTGSIRCEVMVTKNDFEKLNSLSDEKYSNPRNAASGLSQRLDGKYTEFCSLYAVDLFVETALMPSLPKTSTEQSKINYLKELGFTTVEVIPYANFDDIETIYQQFLTQKRLAYPFEIDGLVVKINDLDVAQKLGVKNHRPQFQVAYKFPSQSNQTVIKAVVWQVGPLGNITPVAQVEPIELAGAVITFASLSNYDLIKEKNINVGDIVEISRRGDVIPHIESVVTKVTPNHLLAPDLCPSCGTKLVVEDRFLKCPNTKNCEGQILGSLRIFCDTLNILGLSDKTIAKLYHAHRLQLPGDFYTLTVNDIKDLENLGDKSAKNIIYQIQSKKTLTLKQLFDAAVIPNFSAQRIQQLISAGFDTPEKLLNISQSEIESLPGFQKTLADKVWQGIQLRRPWIKSILTQVNLKKEFQKNIFNNLIFVITGELSQSRQKIVDLIETNGGKVSSAVSKNTSYLICNQPSDSDKYQTAEKLGVKIITENDFQKLL
jgi:DNA ligase (NAD+)